jgi:NAD(P)-dependent dehydrogenase (short-subunit alcohol dehydrogenase family)
MNMFADKVAIVTGAAAGIGRAIAQRLDAHGAKVAIFDKNADAAARVAGALTNAIALAVDVTDESAVQTAIRHAVETLGAVDFYFSNAGIPAGNGLGDNADWAESWSVNTLSHLYAAREVLPQMAERTSGHFVVTSSAGGILMLTKSAHYTATKHAAVALAEWLAVEWGDRGIGVHCLVPGAVRTQMATNDPKGFKEATSGRGHFVEPEEVADAVLAAIASGEFLVLSHPEIHDYEAAKVADRSVWLSKLRRQKSRMS